MCHKVHGNLLVLILAAMLAATRAMMRAAMSLLLPPTLCRRLRKDCNVSTCEIEIFEQSNTSSINVPKQGPPTEGKNEVEMTPAEGIAATVLEIIRLEGELNRARARLAVNRAEERAFEKKRLAQLRNLDISSIEGAGDSQTTPF